MMNANFYHTSLKKFFTCAGNWYASNVSTWKNLTGSRKNRDEYIRGAFGRNACGKLHNCATRVHQRERKDWRDTRIGADHSSTRATVHFEAGSFVCWTTASTNWAIQLDFRLPCSPNHLHAPGRDSFASDNLHNRDISNINSNAW